MMSPRRYQMSKREELAAKTRERIVESTLTLHSEHGILGTSWKDIATAADVSVGTVYKHFPSLDELLPACGALMMERFRPPQPHDAEALAGQDPDPGRRMTAITAAVFEFYNRAGPAAEIDPRERKLASIQEWESYWSGVLTTFVEMALAPLKPDERTVAFASGLLDQRSFAALTARGILAAEAADEVSRMIIAWLQEPGRLKNYQQRSTS
jgi:AcrR family transcriptional regulator